jgi:ribosome-associated toxin RatA of RatAB toxin-antitoxin module
MIDAEVTRIISGSHDQVWDLLTDLTTVDEYHPEVKSVDLLSSNKKGLGATRVCHFYDGTSVKETVTALDDMHMLLELSDYSFPMKDFFAEIAAKSLDSNKTEVTFMLHYTVKYGPIGHLLGVTLMKAKMKSLLKTVLAAINERVETGEPVQKKGQ